MFSWPVMRLDYWRWHGIGNMGDITLRALDTLRAVDLVASEDTRKTGLLLKHFEKSCGYFLLLFVYFGYSIYLR
jgi:hypothetical protein